MGFENNLFGGGVHETADGTGGGGGYQSAGGSGDTPSTTPSQGADGGGGTTGAPIIQVTEVEAAVLQVLRWMLL